ncbi:hypothetical protein VPNG_03220 [Cytospora leucostoma]|uniref:Uncharacterized protein n=1 Tax=Cytospora leucostoma TaxID=1230097 RepID=A0A423XEH3_9PEZI|nr:hypothetical protein VPNG_03220 [Cytospora leucostoma]
MSIASNLRKLLPGNRSERGHTLRKRGYHYPETIDNPSKTASKSGSSDSYSQQNTADILVGWDPVIERLPSRPSTSKDPSTCSPTQQIYLERREKRRLRRSLKDSGDFLGVQGINPVTGELDVLTPTTSSAGEFASLTKAVQDKRDSYEKARRRLEIEKLQKWERDKQAIRAEHRNLVRWKKKRTGWSSAVEPDLSPIAQSSAATTPRGEASLETVVRTPSVRRSSENYIAGSHGPDTMTPGQSSSTPTSGPRRAAPPSEIRLSMYHSNTQPSYASHLTVSSQRSYSDLIPVESEFPRDPSPKPPKIGPKPVG